jgi:hypothetical protein
MVWLTTLAAPFVALEFFGMFDDWLWFAYLVWLVALYVMTWRWFGARKPPS